MSGLVDRLALVITADGAGAIKEFQKVGAAAEKDLGKAEDRTKKVGSQMQATGVAMIGAGALIVGAMVETAKAAEEANVEHLKLDNTLKNSPQLANANKQAFLDQATALQKLTVVDDEAVIGVQALLGQFGLTQTQITEMTPLVVDLSRKMGIDLDTAAKMVGKSVDGSAGALKKAGITVDETAFKTDHYGATMAALSQKVGGYAQAEGQTFAGQLEITKNRLHDVVEGVGVGAVDAFNKMLGPVQALSDRFTELDAGTQSTIGTIGAYAGVGLIAAGAASTLIGTLIKMKSNFSAAAEAARSAGSSLGTVGGALRGLSFAAAAAGVVVLTKRLQDNADEARRWANDVTGGGTLPEKIAKTTAELDKQRAVAERYASLDFGNVLHIAGSNEGRDAQDKMRALEDELKRLQDEEKGAKEGADLTARGVDELGNAVGDSTDKVKDARDAWDKAKNALKGYFDQAFGSVDAQRNVVDTQQAMVDKIVENNQKAWGAFDLSTQAGRDNQAAFEDAAKAVIEYGQKQHEAGVPQAENTRMVQDQIGKLREQAIAHGISAQKVDDYIAKLGLTPQQIETRFNAPGLDEARDSAERLGLALGFAASQIDILKAKTSGDGSLTAGFSAFGSMFGGHRAGGGPVDAGRPYVVGDGGTPELFVPKTDGVILNPAQVGQVAAASGGSAAPMVIHTHVSIDGREIATAITRYEGSIR